MGSKTNVTGSSGSGKIPSRRRNPHGSEVELVSASVPKELALKINSIVIATKKSRSLVISELIEKGLNHG